MNMQREPGTGALYRLDPDRRLPVVETGVSLCNSSEWNAGDDRMYVVDSFRRRILAYPFISSRELNMTGLYLSQTDRFSRDGFLFPLPAFDGQEIAQVYDRFTE